MDKQNKEEQMRNFLLTIVLGSTIMASGVCYAQAISVGDVLQKAGATEGVLYDIKNQRGLNFLAATVYEGTGITKNFAVVAGLVSTDGIGLAVNYDVGNALPKVNFPILSIVNYLRVGVGGAYRTITVHTDTVENSKADDKWIWGPTVFVKFNF